MERWRFGHPRMVRLPDRPDRPGRPDRPDDEVFVVYYAGDDAVKTARWARVRV